MHNVGCHCGLSYCLGASSRGFPGIKPRRLNSINGSVRVDRDRAIEDSSQNFGKQRNDVELARH
jgi:hypothetical protein